MNSLIDFEGCDDEGLMNAIKLGHHQAFSFLVRRHTDRFFKTAYRLCGNVQEAEDLVQEAFLKIWQKPDIWKEGKGAKFTTWFYRILFNQRMDKIRQNKRTVAVQEGFFDDYADIRKSPESEISMTQEQALIEAAINSLSIRQKMAITMCFYEDVTNIDAAYAMNISIKALESLLMRAKTGIKDFLNNNQDYTMNKEIKYASR